MNLIGVLSFHIYRLLQDLHLIQSLWEIQTSAQLKWSKQSRKSRVSEGCSYRLFLLLSIWNLWLPHELTVLHTTLQNFQRALLYKTHNVQPKTFSKFFLGQDWNPQAIMVFFLYIAIINVTFTDFDIILVSFFLKINIMTLIMRVEFCKFLRNDLI